MSQLLAHSAYPCCLYMLHDRAERPRCMSMLRTSPCCISLLLVHAAFPYRAARECCMPMLHVHAAFPCCMSMLHVHVYASCPCGMALRRRNERQVLRMYSAISRSHSTAMDGCRVARFACEASPGLLPGERYRWRSQASSSPGNMVANPPESRILPRTDGWSWWRGGSVLNPLEDVFSIRIHPLDPGDYMLSQKLLVDIGADLFASGNWLLATYICKTWSHPTPIFCFCHFAMTSGPCRHFFTLKTMFAIGEIFINFHTYAAVSCRALSRDLAASDLYGDIRPAHPPH
jgi:hypothetical protein